MTKLLLAGVATAVLALLPLQGALADEKAAIGAWGVDTAGLSRTVRPGDDFYRYVNEGWLKTAKLPPGMASIDPFVEVQLSTEQRVAEIITEAREGNDAPGTPERMIADFHRSHSDTARRTALGITPIASTLSIVGGLKSRDDLAKVMAWPWLGGMVVGGVSADSDDPRRQIAIIGAAGMTMPSRDYYLNEGEPYAGYRKALQA
jgi:endothelin-converting enzyme/putative endopeptidase